MDGICELAQPSFDDHQCGTVSPETLSQIICSRYTSSAYASRLTYLFGHASYINSSESARFYEIRLLVVRQHSKRILPDACPTGFAICCRYLLVLSYVYRGFCSVRPRTLAFSALSHLTPCSCSNALSTLALPVGPASGAENPDPDCLCHRPRQPGRGGNTKKK